LALTYNFHQKDFMVSDDEAAFFYDVFVLFYFLSLAVVFCSISLYMY